MTSFLAMTIHALMPYLATPFHALPESIRARAFGVNYVKFTDPRGGELYITRHGWPMARHLAPEAWYSQGQYFKKGRRLTGGTGTVYRFHVSSPGEPRAEFVVKFSRFAEHVPLFMPSTLPDDLPGYLADSAKFNSPFEEFALIEDLRRGAFGPPRLRIRTKRPLAIYCTPGRSPLWQLGRTEGRFSEYDLALQRDQAGRRAEAQVHLDIERQYIMLYGWVSGDNAEDLELSGVLTPEEVEALTRRVNRELHEKGFRILDNKPKHLILRRLRDGGVMRRGGDLVYVQVDFELLQRTDDYMQFLQEMDGI